MELGLSSDEEEIKAPGKEFRGLRGHREDFESLISGIEMFLLCRNSSRKKKAGQNVM